FDAGEIVLGELDLHCAGVLLEVRPPLRSRDRHDVLATREHPGERELRGRDPLLARNLLDALDEIEIAPEGLSLEAGMVLAEVVLVEVVGRAEAPGEETASEWAVRDEPDSELAGRLEHAVVLG